MSSENNAKENKTVMVVDDDEAEREYLSDILQRNGFEVISVTSALKALTAIQHGTLTDLVITDLMMPDMNGLELVEAIRKIVPAIPFLMITAHAGIESYFKAFALGVMEYINKPIDESELLQIVKKVIKKANERRSYRMNHNL